MPRTAALVIAPHGALVDQLSGDPLERAHRQGAGHAAAGDALRDVIDALRSRARRRAHQGRGSRPRRHDGRGLEQAAGDRGELERFKESGKPVIAVGDGFTRDQYYLAAQADDVFMHPMGLVLVDGYSRFLPYYKSLLDKIYVDYNVWTVGEYKSFVEPITRDDMSPQDEEASESLSRCALERLSERRDGRARAWRRRRYSDTPTTS